MVAADLFGALPWIRSQDNVVPLATVGETTKVSITIIHEHAATHIYYTVLVTRAPMPVVSIRFRGTGSLEGDRVSFTLT